jgi:hypothetical protein
MLPWILGGQMGNLATGRKASRRNGRVAPRIVISFIILLGLLVFAGALRLAWFFILGA